MLQISRRIANIILSNKNKLRETTQIIWSLNYLRIKAIKNLLYYSLYGKGAGYNMKIFQLGNLPTSDKGYSIQHI